MKQIITMAVIALAGTVLLAAQPQEEGGLRRFDRSYQRERPAREAPVVLRGNLALINGHIAIQEGGKVYYITGLDRLTGFIDGLKEGASVSLEGYSFDAPRRRGAEKNDDAPSIFAAAKLTLNGREYTGLLSRFDRQDFSGPQTSRHFQGGPSRRDSRDRDRSGSPRYHFYFECH